MSSVLVNLKAQDGTMIRKKVTIKGSLLAAGITKK